MTPSRWAIAVVGVAAVGVAVWWWWPVPPQAPAAIDPLSPAGLDARLLQAEQALVSQQRVAAGLERRLADTEARHKVLRDEMLASGQRLALLEDGLRALGERDDDAVVSLRLQELELLLVQAEARLNVGRDPLAAGQALALADDVLAQLTGAEWVNLRQSLVQERRALDDLPADVPTRAARDVDAFEAALPGLAAALPAVSDDGERSAWERVLAAVVEIRPRGQRDLLAPQDQLRGETALALEIGLARAALERRDALAFRAALQRAEAWLPRLYAPSPALEAERERLAALRSLDLAPAMAGGGGTLALLRQIQARRETRR